jgi:hypothetical protein
MRFSLLSLLAFVVVTGLWLFGMMYPYRMLTASISGLVIVVLVGAWILAKVSERKKAFWTGFAIAAWVYFLLTMPTYSFGTTRHFVPTNIALNAYTNYCSRSEMGYINDLPELDGEEQTQIVSNPDGTTVIRPNFDLTNIIFIGHGYFTLLSGVLGGMFAVWVRRRETAAQNSTPPAAQ